MEQAPRHSDEFTSLLAGAMSAYSKEITLFHSIADSFDMRFQRWDRGTPYGSISYAANSHNVYSFVLPNKKNNQSDFTPSDWLSTVGPAEFSKSVLLRVWVSATKSGRASYV